MHHSQAWTEIYIFLEKLANHSIRKVPVPYRTLKLPILTVFIGNRYERKKNAYLYSICKVPVPYRTLKMPILIVIIGNRYERNKNAQFVIYSNGTDTVPLFKIANPYCIRWVPLRT